MTERIKEQISVFMDDELSSQECEFFVRRLQREPESRRQFVRYQVIGAAIRGERVIANHGDLRARLQVALDGDHDVLTRPQGRGRFGRLAAGAGIAAAVAAVAFLAVRFADLNWTSSGTELPVVQADERLERVEPPSHLVPRRAPEVRLVSSDIRLTGLQYLMYHGGHASNLRRTVVHSNVVAGIGDDAVVQNAIWEDVTR